MYNQGLFRDWVPKLVQLLLILIFTIVIVPVNGVYVGNVSYMVGSTGIQTEYFVWANYAGVIGMGAAMPIILRMKFRFKIRDKVTFIFILIGILSYVNGTTDRPYLMVANSLIIGYLKMIILLEFIIPIMMMIAPEGNRGKFYSVFYPFSIITSQIAGYVLTILAYDHNWEYVHMVAAAICLGLALIAWIFMHEKYFGFKMPLHYIDWISILIFVAMFMFGAYVLAFGKQQDWIHSPSIINATIASFVSLIILVVRQYTLKRPYLSFKIFRRNNVIHGLIMLLFTGMFLATGSIQSIFTVGILGYDPVVNASLNLLMIPGIVAAGVYMAYWFRQGRGLKMFIFLGFAAMLAYTMIMYFSMTFEFNFERWILPMVLKGFGMGALFIAVWYYTLDKLDMNQMMAGAGLVLVWRTFFSVAIFSALFSWLQYQFQIESIGNLAIYMDGNSISYNQVMGNMKAIQLNAILAANKRLLGYVCIAGVGVLMYILAYHFGVDRHHTFRLMKLTVDKRKHNTHMRRRKQLQQIEDAAGAVI